MMDNICSPIYAMITRIEIGRAMIERINVKTCIRLGFVGDLDFDMETG